MDKSSKKFHEKGYAKIRYFPIVTLLMVLICAMVLPLFILKTHDGVHRAIIAVQHFTKVKDNKEELIHTGLLLFVILTGIVLVLFLNLAIFLFILMQREIRNMTAKTLDFSFYACVLVMIIGIIFFILWILMLMLSVFVATLFFATNMSCQHAHKPLEAIQIKSKVVNLIPTAGPGGDYPFPIPVVHGRKISGEKLSQSKPTSKIKVKNITNGASLGRRRVRQFPFPIPANIPANVPANIQKDLPKDLRKRVNPLQESKGSMCLDFSNLEVLMDVHTAADLFKMCGLDQAQKFCKEHFAPLQRIFFHASIISAILVVCFAFLLMALAANILHVRYMIYLRQLYAQHMSSSSNKIFE